MAPPYLDLTEDEEEPLLLKITGLVSGYTLREPFLYRPPAPSTPPPPRPIQYHDGPALPLQEPPRRHPMPVLWKIAYGVGHILNDICASMWFSYTLLFFHVVLGMEGYVAGALLLLGQVVDALATPVVGILADKNGSGAISAFGRWSCGRRKSWHIGGTIAVLVSFPFIFMSCLICSSFEENAWIMPLYFSVLVTIFQVGWATVQISHLSLIPDLTPSEHERTELTAIRYSMSVCSNVAVYFITWMVLHLNKGEELKIGPNDAYKFKEIVLIGIALGMAFTIFFHVFLKEPAVPRRSYQNLRGSDKDIPMAATSTAKIFKDPRLYQVALLYVSSRLYATLSQVYIPLYLDESLDKEAESLAVIPLVSYASSFVTSLTVKFINKSCGRKVTYLIGGIVSIIACMWIYYGEGPSYVEQEIYIVAVLIGAGSSITLVTSLCITADLIGANTESGASVYSAVTFADKLFNGIAVMIIENMKCTGFCPHYYRDALAFACGGTAAFGLVSLATLIPVFIGAPRGN